MTVKDYADELGFSVQEVLDKCKELDIKVNNSDDYLNCPLNKEEYEIFYNELINAERAELHDIDKNNNNN